MGLSANESSLPSPPKPPPADQYPVPAPRTRSGNASIYDRPPDTQIQPFQTPSSASYPLSPIREQPDASTIVGGNLGSGEDEEDEDWPTIGPWVPGPYFGLSPGAYIPPPPASAPSPLPLPRFPETGENEYTTPSQHVQGEIVEGSTINQKLFDFSRGLYPEVWYKFKRFETLSLLNLYNYQHELVQLDKKINDAKGGMNDNDVANLRRLLQEYRKFRKLDVVRNISNIETEDDAIKSFKEISQLKRPVMDGRQKTVDLFTTKLNDGHYKSAGDALSMVDLTPEALGVPPDGIRVFLQRRLPPALGYQMQTTSLQTPAYSYPSYDRKYLQASWISTLTPARSGYC